MMGKGYTLFKILGIDIRIDVSWLLLFLLITWSLARGVFPLRYEDLPREIYWWMGLAGALGLFASILIHELCHSVVARRLGIPIRGITLFIFGGVSEMTDEPPSPRAEALMAIVGPLASVLLGLGLWGLAAVGRVADWPVPLRGVLGYLAFINFLVAGFNMLPAFPLDGGRVLRAALWRWHHDLRRATRVASRLGAALGVLLAVLGLARVLFLGDFIGGFWYFLIGMYLRDASRGAYEQVLLKQAFAGERVRRFMRSDPITVPPWLTVAELVEQYLYRHHFRSFPVLDGDRLVGCVTIEQVRALPREAWGHRRVEEIMAACSPDNRIAPDADVMEALQVMTRTGTSHLMVVEGGRLSGMIALKDLLGFFALKMELDEPGAVRGLRP